MKRSAFTLIELLVVISLIALLIALLLPALGAARESAINAGCLANTRSMGQAWHSYATDNKGNHLVSYSNTYHGPNPVIDPDTGEQGVNWAVPIQNYLDTSDNEILNCPSADQPVVASATADKHYGTADKAYVVGPTGHAFIDEDITGGYGMNNWIEGPGTKGFIRNWPSDLRRNGMPSMAKVVAPSLTPAFLDAVWDDVGYPRETDRLPVDLIDPINSTGTGYMMRVTLDRHSGGINAVMADGSASAYQVDQLWSLIWHKSFITREQY